MKIHRLLLLLLLIHLSQISYAQDYIQYQRHFNYIDAAVKKNKLGYASKILDSVNAGYSFVFSKHCMMALQICCRNKDSVRAATWLSRCFLQGIPAWIIRQNEITRESLNYTNTSLIWQDYDSLRWVYKSSIDTLLARRIENLMEKDMRYTNKVNNGFILWRHTIYGLQWIHNNAVVHRELKSIIEQRGFPGERLIGLSPELEDSVTFKEVIRKTSVGLELTERRAFFMMLHYFTTPRNHINPLLFKSVLTGNLPVEYYARISDYHYSESKHRKRDSCYYTHHNIPNEDISIINKRRSKIGLFPIEQQKENMDLYWTRRKAGTINKEIIYE